MTGFVALDPVESNPCGLAAFLKLFLCLKKNLSWKFLLQWNRKIFLEEFETKNTEICS